MMKTHFIGTVGRSDVYHRASIVGDDEMNRFLDQTGEVLLEIGDILPVERFHAATRVNFYLASSRTFLCTSSRKWMTNTSINFYFSMTSRFLVVGIDVRCEIWDGPERSLGSHIAHQNLVFTR